MLYKDLSVIYAVEPHEYSVESPKEILQYAVGGMLYMPASRTKIVGDIRDRHKPYHTICLDLEDAIGDDTLKQAEECLVQILMELLDVPDLPLIFIRVRNPKHLEHIMEILPDCVFNVIAGFVFPKFDKTNSGEYIRTFMDLCVPKMISHKLYFMPVLESKPIIYTQERVRTLIELQDELSAVSDYVLGVRVGATDFCNLFGIRRNITTPIYRIRVIADCFSDIINVFARNYVCSGPVWEYFDSEGRPGYWSEGLRREIMMDQQNGFFGKTCIHPSQLPYVAASGIVRYEDYQDAVSILGMHDGLVGVQKGYGGNKMNEYKTHTNWAKRIVTQSYIYGVREGA